MVDKTVAERRVLSYLAENYGSDTPYYDFATIAGDTKLDRKQVRRICRALKRAGFAKFASGLTDEDGGFRGSGYAATNEGAALAASFKA